MKSLRILFAAAFAFAAISVGLAGGAVAQVGATLTGEWHGHYFGGGNQQTEFELEMTQRGRTISGTIVEQNNFANQNNHWLVSEFNGTSNGVNVQFVKTYTDVDAGVSHSVSYVGTVSNGGRRITGVWSIQGQNGRFEMVR